MNERDIIFTVYHGERQTTYTLYWGNEDYGWQHIIERRPQMEDKLEVIKDSIKYHDVAYWDSRNIDKGDRERLYCRGMDDECPDLLTAVVVENISSCEATIITAWQTDSIPAVDKVISYEKN